MITKILAIGIALLLGFGAVGCSNEEAVDENNNTQQEQVQSNPNIDRAYELVNEFITEEDRADGLDLIKLGDGINVVYYVDEPTLLQVSGDEFYQMFVESQNFNDLPKLILAYLRNNGVDTTNLCIYGSIYCSEPNGQDPLLMYAISTTDGLITDSIDRVIDEVKSKY